MPTERMQVICRSSNYIQLQIPMKLQVPPLLSDFQSQVSYGKLNRPVNR